MPSRRGSALEFALLVTIVVSTGTSLASAQRERVLHRFLINTADGLQPDGGLVADKAGNLYGTTFQGGSAGLGTVYELSRPAKPGGAWTEIILHDFLAGSDGAGPVGSLTIDQEGNLFGTTFYGGVGVNGNSNGTAFELSPPSVGGEWSYSVIASFDNDIVAINPLGGMVLDGQGNLYGVSGGGVGNGVYCGDYPCGNVFELQPPKQAGEPWTGQSIYNFFTQGTTDGIGPSGLMLGSDGSLYGTTGSGGTTDSGTVFKLTPPPKVKGAGVFWNETILYNFSPSDGAPIGGVIAGPKGTFFGTTEITGVFRYGTIYQLIPEGGLWTESVLYNFSGGDDGGYPVGGVVSDKVGNLYGTALGGAVQDNGECLPGGAGTVFRLSPPAVSGGPWSETTLHDFAGGSDGCNPVGRLLLGELSLFGVSEYGGNPKYGLGGTVFRIAK
jgi:uncharacterized repeat protein (TIGR03803 family)